MRAIFISICLTLLILQAALTTINGIPTAKVRSVDREPSETKTDTGSVRRTKTRPAEKKLEEIPESENDDEVGSGYETETQPPRRAGSQLGKTVKAEAGKRRAGLVDTTTDLVRAGSNGVGQMGKFARKQLKNAQQIGEAKLDAFSALTGAFTDVTTQLARGTQHIFGESGKALTGVIKDGSKAVGSGIELSGRILKVPIKAAKHGLRFGNGVVQVPTKVTKWGSKKALDSLSLIGIHNNEDDEKNVSFEEIEEVAPPPPPPSPSRARQISKRTNSKN